VTVTDANAWQARYDTADTPWDLGEPAPALLEWLKMNPGQGRRALVPGCGRGHDALALAQAGWGVVAVDFAASAIEEARAAALRTGVALNAYRPISSGFPPTNWALRTLVRAHLLLRHRAWGTRPLRRTRRRTGTTRRAPGGGFLCPRQARRPPVRHAPRSRACSL
jgi:SAM-dependent methyltransferase